MKVRATIAVVLVSVMAFGLMGVAVANVQPTLTISASKADAKVRAAGVYNPQTTDPACPKSGKTVTLFVDSQANGSAQTTGLGGYNALSAKVSAGTHSVYTFVPGDMSGSYGANIVCDDAVSEIRAVTTP